MADPDHTPTLDGLDVTTVVLYRAGLTLTTVLLTAACIVGALGGDPVPVLVGITASVMLSVANLHLYDKRIRWVIVMLGSSGPAVVALSTVWDTPGGVVRLAGVGLSYAALSGLALKEGFCFRVPGVRLVPVALAVSLLPLLWGAGRVAAPVIGLAALVLIALTVAKLRMPLSHDIGDRSKYQV